MKADPSLARLRDRDAPHARGLAALALDHVLDTPLETLVDPAWLAERIAQGMHETSNDQEAKAAIVRRIERQRARLRTETRPVRTWLPSDSEAPLRELLSQPWSPSEELTFKIINHPALRTLVREILKSTLTRFAGRLRNLDQGVLGGLGGRAVRRGRGLFGGVAEGIVGAVREEMGSAIEGRIKDFLGGATEEAVRGIAAWLSDPAHADSLAAMRVSAMDVVLDTPVADLATEGDSLGTEEMVDLIWKAVAQASARPELARELEDVVRMVLTELEHDTLRAALGDLGFLETWHEATLDWLTGTVHRVVDSDAFATWWAALHEA